VVWTAIPTVLVMLMFWYGWEGYLSLRRIPDDAMHIKATARMWSWLFTYDNGKTADKLFVPVGQPVKVELAAEDVLHSFYVPAFRVKRDTVPGMTNWVWFTAEQPGSYDLFCAEYCGVGHSAMVTTVEALPNQEFQAWLTATGSAAVDPAAHGAELAQQLGCLGCHSVDGSRRVGPSLQGIFGAERNVSRDGQQITVVADPAYLTRALREPAAEIVAGYPPAMPPFAGLTDNDVQALIAWLESLK
jgi:cytochrome c oxidase subunit 2